MLDIKETVAMRKNECHQWTPQQAGHGHGKNIFYFFNTYF